MQDLSFRMLPTTYVRIPHKRFLDDFWPVPAPDLARYKPRSRQSKFKRFATAFKNLTVSSKGKPPADALVS